MPLYDLTCRCGYREERLMGIAEEMPPCPKCSGDLRVGFSAPPMVKIKGMGGFPSRRRQIFNTTSRSHPRLEKDTNTQYF